MKHSSAESMQSFLFVFILLLLLGLVTLFRTEDPTEVKYPRRPMKIEAHRGAGRLAAENTKEAFELAIELGIDGVEIDVWLSKDKVPIVVHGLPEPNQAFVDLDSGRQKIIEIDSTKLKDSRLKNGEKILTLAETLDICRDRISLNIEFKDWREEVVGRVLDVLQEKNMLEQVSFSSFSHRLRKRLTIETVRRGLEPMSFGYISSSVFPKFPNYVTAWPGDSINVDVRYMKKDPEAWLRQMEKVKERGLKIKIWFPMIFKSEIEHYDELIRIGVDTIITNEPLAALEYFESEVFKEVSE